ncbi:MAG TPA: beta-1,6-N-acetylglucosaminyltransferase [Verrucomicrobiae bacterium]
MDTGSRTGFAPGGSASTGLRIAYIISAYRQPQMLIRLVNRLQAERTQIYIHYDLRSPESDFAALKEAFRNQPNVVLLERHRCRWGDFGHVQASLKGIQAALQSDNPPDYAILLTGQDYPLQARETIEDRLRQTNGGSFLEASPWPIANWENGQGIRRIEYYHLHLALPNWVRRLGWPANMQHLKIRMHRQVPGGLHPYFGNGYWTLHRSCLEYLQNYVDSHPDFVQFFKGVLIPDECFFQIILMNSPLAPTIVSRSLTFVTWRPPWPAILNTGDLPVLAETDCLFARKFDLQVDASVLDHLDRQIDQSPVLPRLPQASPSSKTMRQ